MPVDDHWSENRRTDAERRKILERRRQERIAAADAAAEAAAAAGVTITTPTQAARGRDRRDTERRQAQVCFVCHNSFEPQSNGQIICPECQMDGVRGGPRSGRKGARF
jgi:hypothetical protein